MIQVHQTSSARHLVLFVPLLRACAATFAKTNKQKETVDLTTAPLPPPSLFCRGPALIDRWAVRFVTNKFLAHFSERSYRRLGERACMSCAAVLTVLSTACRCVPSSPGLSSTAPTFIVYHG